MMALAVAAGWALLFAGVAAPTAWAHGGGGAAGAVSAGPFRILVYDGVIASEQSKVQYALLVTDAASGKPVDDVKVSVTASSGPLRLLVGAEGIANVYRYSLPSSQGRTWDVTVLLQGPGGTGSASFAVHRAPGSGATGEPSVALASLAGCPSVVGALLAGAGGGVVVALVVLVSLGRRSRRAARMNGA